MAMVFRYSTEASERAPHAVTYCWQIYGGHNFCQLCLVCERECNATSLSWIPLSSAAEPPPLLLKIIKCTPAATSPRPSPREVNRKDTCASCVCRARRIHAERRNQMVQYNLLFKWEKRRRDTYRLSNSRHSSTCT